MTYNYQLAKTNTSGKQKVVIRTVAGGDGKKTWIPFDDGNADYQTYLEWVAAGKTPTAAD